MLIMLMLKSNARYAKKVFEVKLEKKAG